MTHYTRQAAGSREPRGGAWRSRPIGLEPQPRSPDGGGWVEAWEPANVRRSPASCFVAAGILFWKNALLQLKHGRQKQETQGAGSRGGAGCVVCFQSPKFRGRSCWGSPKQEARGQAGARRIHQRPGAPSQARYAPIQCPGLHTLSVLALCPAEDSQSRADGIRSSTHEPASCRVDWVAL